MRLDYLPIAIIRVIALLPPAIAYCISKLLAILVAALKLQLAQTAKLNLRIAYPQLSKSQKNKKLHNSLHQSIYSTYEIAKIWTAPFAKTKKKFLSQNGAEILHELIEAKKPVILLCPHLGCWEAVGYWLNTLGHKMSILYKPMDNQLLDDFMIQARGKAGNEVVPVNAQGIRRIYKDLKENKIVGILPDQAPKEEGSRVMAPFFSADAATMTLIHTLIQKTKATPILITSIREGYHGFHIHIQKGENVINADVKESVTAMNQNIEKLIALAPEQYQWSYRRYRYNPLIDYNKSKIAEDLEK
jgi:KDO2-lipid IV(A) lauroyltransferase